MVTPHAGSIGRPPRRGRTQLPALAGVALLLASLSGYIGGILPTGVYHHADDCGHNPIDASVVRSLRPGETTRSQAVAALGDPTLTLAAGRLLVYSWTTRQEVRFIWGFAEAIAVGGHGGGRFGLNSDQTNFLALQFDRADVLHGKRTNQDGRLNTGATNLDDVFE